MTIFHNRLTALRTQLQAEQIDALIVPRYDAHQGEYLAPHDERLAYLTGFTGSAGLVLITHTDAILFVDGRYSVQAEKQSPPPLFSHQHLFDTPLEDWLATQAQAGWRIGYDPMHLPPAWVTRFQKGAKTANAQLIPTPQNLVDRIWADQPAPPMGRITAFPTQLAGKSVLEKQGELLTKMQQDQVDLIVETQPDNIAWLLNMRGNDMDYNPMAQGFLIITKTGIYHWFVTVEKCESDLLDMLPASVKIHPMSDFLPLLAELTKPGDRVMADPDFSPQAVQLCLAEQQAVSLLQRSLVTLTKTEKNATELEGMRQSHLADGAAWTDFGAWLMKAVPERAAAGTAVTELEAEEVIYGYRQQQADFKSESFKSISAASGNAAMCHYGATDKQNDPILPTAPYLLDSGGQYLTGTTDATRCFAFGTLPEGYAQAYTAVYQAFYALASLRFPDGTQGHHIDAVCRRPLWQLGLDYDHGTGHSVGHFLSVHEHPQRIGKQVNLVDLRPGMVLTIEPGHYIADHYGIRIENLFEIIREQDGFMAFRTLTYTPILTDMLLLDRLSPAEKDWLNQYHSDCRTILADRVLPETQDWLYQVTEPI